MTTTVVIVFVLVYIGMVLGGMPFLQLDRTGVALLGAIALVGSGAVTLEEAARSVHLPTLILLFSFMVLSAQMRLGGFYTWVTREVAALPIRPAALLAALTAVVAVLSAVFSNDIVCLAIAPVLIDACRQRRLDPLPFLLALACAANIGSAATLIGNPQNMLIGESLRLSFSAHFLQAIVPVLLGLAATWALIAWSARGRWVLATAEESEDTERRAGAVFDPWQTVKGLTIAALLVIAVLEASWPREVAALAAAGILLMNRKLHSHKMLGLVDWELLVLFIGLFVVNHALQQTGVVAHAMSALAAKGVPLEHPAVLFGATFVLSNVVSNVPAVMLLLPAATEPLAGSLLALVSTLAGNLFIVGSIANIIVVDSARRHGIAIDWRTHARIGVPVTAATLAIVATHLWLRTALGA